MTAPALSRDLICEAVLGGRSGLHKFLEPQLYPALIARSVVTCTEILLGLAQSPAVSAKARFLKEPLFYVLIFLKRILLTLAACLAMYAPPSPRLTRS